LSDFPAVEDFRKFYEDPKVGFNKQYQYGVRIADHTTKKHKLHVCEWLNMHVQDKWALDLVRPDENIWSSYVQYSFVNPSDAMLFKLAWA
ncbi:hypothetical protein, partial [Escherichia coli]|uniref:hypothetical protein n=1 Tax=Escherichia coli TaxID=562 RepID=UPI0019628BDA